MSIKIFEPIPVAPPREKIYYRLGYARGKTEVSSSQHAMIERFIDEAVGLIELVGLMRRLEVCSIEAGTILLSDGYVLKSTSLAALLADSQEVLMMGATAGHKITEAIQDTSENDDVTRAVIFDAAASEVVDEALVWISRYMTGQLRRENKKLTKQRFSCGYSDFTLDQQHTMVKALDMKNIGVSITDTSILIPEKSVTAVAGIELISL